MEPARSIVQLGPSNIIAAKFGMNETDVVAVLTRSRNEPASASNPKQKRAPRQLKNWLLSCGTDQSACDKSRKATTHSAKT
jgi:hypothetical protein